MLLKCIQVFEEYLMHILSVKDKKSVIKKNSLKIQIYFMIVAIQQTKTVFSDTLSFIFFFLWLSRDWPRQFSQGGLYDLKHRPIFFGGGGGVT